MSTTPTEVLPSYRPADPLLLVRGLAGAAVGGLVGYFIFRWLSKNGFYAIMVPGLLMGMGAGFAARGRSPTLGMICLFAALVLGVVAEWLRSPFVQDESFAFFVRHLLEMRGANAKLLMMGLGAAAAWWFGQGR